ncbi:MAG: Kdo hydroxylase family protein [Gammaproteobacteria bacterium]
MLHSIEADNITHPELSNSQHIVNLESGQIIYLPQLSFKIDNPNLLNPSVCDTKKKNISYDYQKQKLGGISKNNPYQSQLMTMMHAYALYARSLVDTILPQYHSSLRWGRTSYRPVEIIGRKTSKRQDDTRVHVDAFPSTPVQGWRILRVFCNVNPNDKPREWHLGEAFSEVLTQFSAQFPSYSPAKAWLLQHCKITKSLRSAYDHYMLHLHDKMKLSDHYQKNLAKIPMDFAAQSTWIVFTDVVSHAALSGQYLLEQTFYLPISAMNNALLSPYKQLEAHGLI